MGVVSAIKDSFGVIILEDKNSKEEFHFNLSELEKELQLIVGDSVEFTPGYSASTKARVAQKIKRANSKKKLLHSSKGTINYLSNSASSNSNTSNNGKNPSSIVILRQPLPADSKGRGFMSAGRGKLLPEEREQLVHRPQHEAPDA